MANERLRAALTDAGIDAERLAELIGVQLRSVERWLGGGTAPTPRHQAAVARALGRPPRELWPEGSRKPADDLRQEIRGLWGHADDIRATDWKTLLGQASSQIDLLALELDEILGTPGTPELLREKARSGCQIRVVLPAPDALWLTEAARQSGRGEADYVGRTELHRQVELAIGYLQPLLEEANVDVSVTYQELSMTILRFDQELLMSLALAGGEPGQRPLLHLERRAAGGLFDRLEPHLDALHRDGHGLERDPEFYPDPRQVPARYLPVTERIYRGQLAWLNRQLGTVAQAAQPASERSGRRRPSRPRRK